MRLKDLNYSIVDVISVVHGKENNKMRYKNSKDMHALVQPLAFYLLTWTMSSGVTRGGSLRSSTAASGLEAVLTIHIFSACSGLVILPAVASPTVETHIHTQE